MAGSPVEGAEARERVLEAGVRLFAELGYAGASVRRLAAMAKVNVAMVKYYFGSKEKLYEEVVRVEHAKLLAEGARPPSREGRKPEEALRLWVGWFVRTILRKRKHAGLSAIMLHEMRNPTPMLDVIIRELAHPIRDELEAIVGDLLGPGVKSDVRKGVVSMVLSMSAQHEQNGAMLHRLGFAMPESEKEVDAFVEMVVKFCLGGIGAIRRGTRVSV